MRVAIYTLGCKVNQYETQAMEQELQRRGHTLVDFESPADAYIINTCSVTAVSDKKSRQMIRRAKSRNPQAVVAACGCYVQTHTPEAQELGIDLIGGTGDRMEFLTLLEQAAEDHRSRVAVDEALRRRTFEVLPAGGMAARTRAMLKGDLLLGSGLQGRPQPHRPAGGGVAGGGRDASAAGQSGAPHRDGGFLPPGRPAPQPLPPVPPVHAVRL